MTTPNPRLMPRTRIFIDKFTWKQRVEGLLATIKFSEHDHLDLIVNGKMLCEDIDYKRIIEPNQRGILFTKLSTIVGWAILKVYK